METLKKRLLSFLWRLSAYLVIAGLAWIVNNLGDLQLPTWAATIIALACGELTKWINSRYNLGSKMLGIVKSK